VRFSQLQVVGVTLVSLLLLGTTQAQFGKLASEAKEKLGMQSKSSSEGQNKGPAGEAKATYATGVKKSLEVSRQSGPTPEASVASATSGVSQTITIKLSHMDARKFDAVRGFSPCNKLSNFQILSATQAKVTIDLSGEKSGGSCPLYFRTDGKTVFTTNVSIRAKK
jgi:hypothetical protein